MRPLVYVVPAGHPLSEQVRNRMSRELRCKLWRLLWGPRATILGPGEDQPFDLAIRVALDRAFED